ncbi:hypothetical protein [Laspinema olomoucense]|uniref:hypothetical protein n=1 Tax=Laspinema olomoucense TaxID=3231600 RepID=UPI0021BA9C58|nr:hypothetical protein [Laspinema sp. D3d]MCT7973409.1 hypothetical protein [Laspinema sp. D3d]
MQSQPLSEQMLFKWQGKLGGNLTRIAIQGAEPVSKFLEWKAMASVIGLAVAVVRG